MIVDAPFTKHLPSGAVNFLRAEWPLLSSWATTLLFFLSGDALLEDLGHPIRFACLLTWLTAVVLVSAFWVVKHAEHLATRLGEPLGTLVLTLAITGIEVMIIISTMSAGEGTATLARDAMFAVIMIVLNGMVGLTLILGALKYHEQEYNLQGASSFLAVILPLAVIGLVVPNFTRSSPGQTFAPLQAVFLALVSLTLYGVFLMIQNVVHRAYFQSFEEGARGATEQEPHVAQTSALYHAALLIAYIAPLLVLSKQLAVPIEYTIRVLHAPVALAGVLVAVLVLSPESLGAVRAALNNDLQRSVNILLGSVLASIGLTIPAILAFGLLSGKPIILGLDPVDITMLAVTLVLSSMTFASSRTNVLLGAVHLLLFFAYVLLIFQR